MALINEKLQITGGYVDASIAFVPNVNGLLSLGNLFEGMSVRIANVIDGKSFPVYAELTNGVAAYNWKLKSCTGFPTYSSLVNFSADVMEKLSITKRGVTTYSTFFGVGTVMNVFNNDIEGSSTSGKQAIYVVESINNGVIVWKEATSAAGGDVDASQTAEGVVERIDESKNGTLVYPDSTLYSYTDEEGKTVYTTDESEAEGKEDKQEYPENLYVITKDSEGNSVLSTVITQTIQEGLKIKVIGDDI